MTDFPLKLDLDNPEFQQAFKLLTQTDVNVFLTGKAGTGKSTFLKYICSKINKKFVILAPTGVADVNVGGMTLHSFFHIPLRPVPPDDPDYSVKAFRHNKKLSRNKKKLIKELELIIIDEVSMVRADTIDFIDRMLRGIRGKRGIPFGGVQLLLVGDVFQLEPVVTADTRPILGRYYPDFLFYNALAYRQVKLVAIELKKTYRQNDLNFIGLLDRVRINAITEQDISLLNTRVGNEKEEKAQNDRFNIVLASRRDIASTINKERMAELHGEEVTYEGEIVDDFPDKLLPTDLLLLLKAGAQVMLVRNDKEKRWVNGTLARIRELGKDYILVELENGNVERVEREVWENITYIYDEKERRVVENIIGRFTQFPLKAAWALTIHKSQGLTFSNVSIDMGGGAFTPGQTYVALSRCRSFSGLHFINPIKRYDVIVSRGAAAFSKRFNDNRDVELAMREAEVKRLSLSARRAFAEGDMSSAVEEVWRANSLSPILAYKPVRRLIAGALSIIKKLKIKIEEQHRTLLMASKDLCEAAYTLKRERGASEEAFGLFRKAIALDSHNSSAIMGVAEILIESGDTENALIELQKAIKLKDTHYVKACVMAGDIFAAQGDISGASLHYRNAAKKSRKDKMPIKRLIKLYQEAGMEDVAEQWKSWLDP